MGASYLGVSWSTVIVFQMRGELQEIGQRAPRLEPGDKWPARLAGFAAIRQNKDIWNSSLSARPSSTSSSRLLRRSRRWRLSCDAAGNSTTRRCRNAGTPGKSVASGVPLAVQSAQLPETKEVRPAYRDIHSQASHDL